MILFSGLLSFFAIQSLILSAEAILPKYIEKNHTKLEIIHGAIIISFTEVSGLIVSPIIGIILEKVGRKNIVVSGFSILAFGTLGLGLCNLIPGKSTLTGDYIFFGVAVLCRFIQGIGDQFVSTAFYSVLSSTFPDSRERIIGFIETAAGLGLMIGPILGGPMNVFFGYLPCYLIFTSFLILLVIIN
jgi:MFS family permease